MRTRRSEKQKVYVDVGFDPSGFIWLGVASISGG
jgi:hypothetical protein